MAEKIYVSITGLRLKRFWHGPFFWRHAIASMSQAQRSDGCLSAEARSINGVHHTLSVWTSRRAMLAFLRAGAHRNAMKSFDKFATGKVLGFEADTPPTWAEAQDLWARYGKTVTRDAAPAPV